MAKSEQDVIEEYVAHFSALERASSQDVSTLSAAAMLHCVQFTRVAGAIALQMEREEPMIAMGLNGLQNLCKRVCSILTGTPSPAENRHKRIVNEVGKRLGMFDSRGVVRVISVKRMMVPEIVLPGCRPAKEERSDGSR